ncbi:GNAT family N-acetyltransferase [Williamsia sp. M5A3_1d]
MTALTIPVLEGEGIRLRPFTFADTAAVVSAGRDPYIPWVTTVDADGDDAAARAYVERQHQRARDGAGWSFAVAEGATDEVMGQIGVWKSVPRHGRFHIGYWVAQEFRGAGVMSRALRLATAFAFGLEGFVRVELFVEPWNAGSRGAARNAGYRCEGLLRGSHLIDGEPRDMLLYARTVLDDPETGRVRTREAVISEATADDAPELLVLQRCCWVAEAIANDTLDIPPLHETLEDVVAWIGDWMTLTVRDGPRLIGSVRGRLAGDTWEIGRLMVAPDVAGQGLGRRLLEQAERLAPAEATTFELFTGARSTRNQRIYRDAGYLLVENGIDTTGHIPGAVVLRKERGFRRSARRGA